MGNRRWRINILLLISFLLLFSISASHLSVLHAANPMDKLTEIQKQLKTKLQKVKDARKKENSIAVKIEDINGSIKKKEEDLKNYNKRLSQTQAKIQDLSTEISLLTSKLDSRKQYLKERIRVLHKRHYGGKALILISAKDYQDLIRKSNYLSLMAHYDSRVIDKYSTDIRGINSKKRDLEILRGKLETNKNKARRKKKELQSDRVKKDKLLAMVRSKRNSYEKKIRELEESSKKLQDMVKRLQKESIPESLIGKGFTSSKGDLPWPVNGKVLIPYGKYRDPEFNMSVFKNGIEIEAKPGDIPKAIAGGRVVYASQFEDYGNLLIIDHGSGYHSVYGNLSKMYLKAGELLARGMDIGKISKSKLSNVPILYFEIRHKGKPVNPIQWLKRKG